MEGQHKEKNETNNIIGWNEASEAALLDMWPTKLSALRGHRKNGHIHAEMAEELSRQGHSCTPRDVQAKLQNLTQRYRKEKAVMGIFDGSPSTWCHYGVVHKIISGFKANSFSELILESIDDVSNSSFAAQSRDTTIPIPSPDSPMSAPSSPLSLYSSSSGSSSSEPARKKQKFNYKEFIIENLKSTSDELKMHLSKCEENEKQLIELQKKKIELEEKKIELLDSIAEENKRLSSALISFLNKK